ncbi:MAG: SDR family oxidoreductase [Alphaproteobacteria bacterium]|nr:MAG: SDR family oxidoreductase [Alphaproteobacteria bacterium]
MKPGALLITGGGKRVGKELALFLGASGYEIAIHYRTSKAAADAVAKTITQGGGQAITLQANLDNTGEAQNLIGRAAEKLGRPVTGLINNAAAFQQDTLESFNETSFEKNINTNLRAPMLLCQAFAKALPKKIPGAIVNIIDQRVLNLTPGFLTYTLSKHALLTLTRILAVELGPQIRVNGIGPGPTLPSVYQSEEDFANEVAGLPLGKGPTLNEIARAAKFLLETPAMTGQMIALDGGQHLL